MIEHDIVFRLRTARIPGTLSKALASIARFGAHVGEIETTAIHREFNVRDVSVIAPSAESIADIRAALAAVPGVEIMDERDAVFDIHQGGKIMIQPRVEVRNIQDIREVYTPGVARVAMAIAEDESLADQLTWRADTVAVVTDGSRVLGLGDIGPAASLPIMEGKALFYSLLVGLNAVPIVLDVHEPDKIIEVVEAIAPGFGGIHLEDIASPGVYRVEDELERRLKIPVMHDDQHGTAVVVMAGVLSAARQLGKNLEDMVFGQVGLGAAGSAIARLALAFDFKRVVAFDPSSDAGARLASFSGDSATDLEIHGGPDGFDKVVATADVLVLTSGRPGLMTSDHVRGGQIIFAISNPTPEISMEDAMAGGAAVAADGTIVNNVLAYPGLFRGALDAHAPSITVEMKRAAAESLAAFPAIGLLPNPLDRDVHRGVAQAVADAARE